MRFRLWHIAVFVVALAVFAIARAPAAVFAPEQPGQFTYTRAEGTIWNARFHGAQLGPYDAGEMSWRMSPLDIVQGKLIGDLAFEGGALTGPVQILANWHGDRRIIAQALTIEGAPLGATLLAGTTRVNGLDLFFSEGRCVTAAGTIETDVLSRNSATLNWRGPDLRGPAACAGEVARISLEGGDATDYVRAQLELRASGEGEWRVEVRTPRTETQAALGAAGFRPDPGSGAFSAVGDMEWHPF